MEMINIHHAKSNFSKYIKMVTSGKEIVICSSGNPVAKLVPYSCQKKPRKPGMLEGQITMKKDFDKLPKSFMKYFE